MDDFDPDECVDDGGHCDHYGAGEDCCYCGEMGDSLERTGD